MVRITSLELITPSQSQPRLREDQQSCRRLLNRDKSPCLSCGCRGRGPPRYLCTPARPPTGSPDCSPGSSRRSRPPPGSSSRRTRGACRGQTGQNCSQSGMESSVRRRIISPVLLDLRKGAVIEGVETSEVSVRLALVTEYCSGQAGVT